MKTRTGISGIEMQQNAKCVVSTRIFVPILLILGVLFFLPLRALAQTVEASEQGSNAIQPPDKVMDAAGVKPGMVIGEVGAGRGRFTVHLAHRVGETGRIYANDINQAGLDHVRDRCRQDGIKNVEIIVGKEEDPLFPKDALDMVFIVMTYHHLSQPVALLKNIIPSLKSGAKVVIVDPDPVKSRWQASETTSPEKMRREATEAGFEVTGTETFLARDNIFILRVKTF
jgi:tRNA A58 N-methylase Trm61